MIDGDDIWALYVVRNADKLRHLAAASPTEESGRHRDARAAQRGLLER